MSQPNAPHPDARPRIRREAGAGFSRHAEGERPELPIDFIHIPKAAGATFQALLQRVYRPRPMVWFKGAPGERELFQSWPEPKRHAVDLVYGHHRYGLGPWLRQPVTTIVFLRDPIDRVVSQYHYVLKTPGHRDHERVSAQTLADYARDLPARRLDNDQVRWLNPQRHAEVPTVTPDFLQRAKDHLADERTLVGLVERFDECVAWFADRFNWPDVRYGHANATTGRPPTNQIDAGARRAIERANELDIELYEHAVALLNEQLAGTPAPVAAPAARG